MKKKASKKAKEKIPFSFLLLIPVLLMLASCVSISISPETKPLKETLVEGRGRPKILLLDLDGVISFSGKRGGIGTMPQPSPVAYFKEALVKAQADKNIAGLIIRINSPGGGVTASDVIYHEIMAFKKKKKVPVYAYIMDIGASGGYYVAQSADRIIASPTALTGSIGVIAMKFDIEGLMSKVGVREETYKSGAEKDFWSPFRPSTPKEKAMLQGIINNLFSRFIEVVGKNRKKNTGLTRQQLLALADGRIFTADQALKAGLIDREAYLDDAIAGMKKRLGIKEARVVTYARPSQYKPTVYSAAGLGAADGGLLSLYTGSIWPKPGVRFMYIWNP